MLSRTPPQAVRATLRKEVNFGCPIQGCGSPYLIYHHFDPEWSERQHHDPEGMIALCRDHAMEADGGAFTKEQLKELKANPYIKRGEVKGRFSWLRRGIICIPGNIIYRPDVILKVGEEKVLWMEKDQEGFHRLNLVVKDSGGKTILKIRNNDWIVRCEEAMDFFCPPSGKQLRLKSKEGKTEINIRFDDIGIDEFKTRLDYMNKRQRIDLKRFQRAELKHLEGEWKDSGMSKSEIEKMRTHTWEIHKHALLFLERSCNKWIERIVQGIGRPVRVTTCTLVGRLFWKGLEFRITQEGLTSGDLTISGAFVVGGTVFHFA